MKYSIHAAAEFLRVTMSGRQDDEPPSHVCKVVLLESARLQRPRILIELDQAARLSPVSQYRLVTRLPELGLTENHRIALVHKRDVNVRNFADAEAAKQWLRGA